VNNIDPPSQVVFEDAESLEQAVDICYNAIFGNHGQNCCAGEDRANFVIYIQS
jgi:acyl-CoA reductase-like NAD-dependent aldehyde dehydrogenase